MKQALADALELQGYDTLTPVQQAVTDPEIGEADLLVSAQTGSGKTVGFGLAIAPTLLGEADRLQAAEAPLALVIAPTRELAMQVKRELTWLYAKAGAVMASCVGGMDMRDERRTLSRGAHIVVATPGRLRDHIMRGSLDMSAIRAIVLDEADEMLDLGFQEDLEFILGEAPADRRTLMFSATVPRGIANLAKKYQKDALRISTTAEKSQHSDIEYKVMAVSARDTENAIINVLRYYEAPNALVFGNTRAMVNRLTTRLSNRGFSVVALSGELSQAERTHALQAMRDGRARICVATDVAARGIDLPNLDLVVHAELPNNHETLLHRSGRTGRAGRKGVSALIIPPAARKKCDRLLRSAKITAEWGEAPSADMVNARDTERMMADPVWHQPLTDAELLAAQELTSQFSAEQIASAYLTLFKSRQSAPEELLPADASSKPEPRAAFGPSIWFSVSGGRNAGAEPRRLLPMLCRAGNITRDDIGAIRVQNDESYVEVLAASVPAFLDAIGVSMTVEDGASLTQLDKAPDLSNSGRPTFRDAPKGRGPKDRGAKDRGPKDYAPKDRAPRDYKPSAPKPDVAAPAVVGAPAPAPAPAPAKPEPEFKKPAKSKPRAEAPSSAPIDWNDDPKPRSKKPKLTVGKKPGKPATSSKPASAKFKRRRPEDSRPDGIVEPYKPKRGAAAEGATAKKPRKPKSVDRMDPPTGKPNSKKNKARRAAASGGAAGGNKPPKRQPKS